MKPASQSPQIQYTKKQRWLINRIKKVVGGSFKRIVEVSTGATERCGEMPIVVCELELLAPWSCGPVEYTKQLITHQFRIKKNTYGIEVEWLFEEDGRKEWRDGELSGFVAKALNSSHLTPNAYGCKSDCGKYFPK